MSNVESTINKDLKQIKKLALKRKIYILVFLFLLFALAFVGGVFITRYKPLPPIPTPVTTPKPKPSPILQRRSKLFLTPASGTLTVGEVLPVSVLISNEPVQAVDVVLLYDPSVFAVSDIKKGDVFPLILRKDIIPGRVTVSASASPEEPVELKTGEVFSFSLTALAATASASIDFDAQDTIAAKDGVNRLGKIVGGKFRIEK